MGQKAKLKPFLIPSENKWGLMIPASLSQDRKRSMERFDTEADANRRAHEIRNNAAKAARTVATLPPEVLRAAGHYHQVFQFYGFSGLEEACRAFEERCKVEMMSPTLRSLIDAYLIDYPKDHPKWLFGWLEGKLSPKLYDRRVGTMDRDFWRDELTAVSKREGWSVKTYNDVLMYLTSLFRHALEHEKVKRNPLAAIKPKQEAARTVRVLEPEQLEAILRRALAINPDAALYFAVLCFAGLRPVGEFESKSGVTWGDVLWSQGLLRIRDTKNQDKTGTVNRYVDLNPTLRSWLEAFKDGKKDSEKISKWTTPGKMRAQILTLEDGSQIVDWSADGSRDIARHSYGSYLAAISTMDHVVKNMGHTSPKTFFRHYRNARTPEQAAQYWALRYEALTR